MPALGLVLLALVALVALGPWRIEAAHPQDSGDYLLEQLPDEDSRPQFRPRSAREAVRAAARQAMRERSPEETIAVLQHNMFGGLTGQRVAVYDAVEATTSRYNVRRFDNFRKAGGEARGWNRGAAVRTRDSAPQASRAGAAHRLALSRSARRPRGLGRGRAKQFEKKKRSRVKRDIVDQTVGQGFTLPPMPNQVWNPKLKKKKKKKKKKDEEVTTKRPIQARNRKHRAYLKSLENLRPKAKKKKSPAVLFIRAISRELKELLPDTDAEEEGYTLRPHVAPTQAKFVPVPQNWQNPPSWRPPTRGTFKKSPAHQGSWQHSYNIVTIGPQPASDETAAPTVRVVAGEATTELPGGEVDSNTPFDWKQYDHPMKTKEELVLKPAPQDWPQPTHPADGIYDWHKSQFKRAPRTPMPWATQAPLAQSGPQGQRFSEETAMYRRNDMWQTRPWNSRPQYHRNRMFLTTGSPGTMDIRGRAPGYNYQTNQDSGRGGGHQESRHYSYQHGPGHSAWQGSVQGQQQGSAGVSQYQAYQQQYANYSSYYNYYHNYYSHLANNSKGFHYQQGYNQQDRRQASGSYQSHYQYQYKEPTQYQYQHMGMGATTENSVHSGRDEVPYRMPTEYAGNDRDLRGAARNRMPWARQGRGFQRPWRRPTGFRSIFSAPLHPWSTTPAAF